MSVAFTEESLVLVTVPKPFGGCRAGAAVAAAAKKVSGAGDPGQKLAHITLRHFLKKSRTQHATALYIAEAYLDLGDKDHAFEWLGRSYQEHSTGTVHDQGRHATRS